MNRTIKCSNNSNNSKRRISWSSYSYDPPDPLAPPSDGDRRNSSAPGAQLLLVDSATTINEGSAANISISSWAQIDTSEIHTTERIMMSRLGSMANHRHNTNGSPKLPTISHDNTSINKTGDADAASISLSSWACLDIDEDPTSRRAARRAADNKGRASGRLASSDSAIRYSSCEKNEPVDTRRRRGPPPSSSRPGTESKPPPSPPTIPKSQSLDSHHSNEETVSWGNTTTSIAHDDPMVDRPGSDCKPPPSPPNVPRSPPSSRTIHYHSKEDESVGWGDTDVLDMIDATTTTKSPAEPEEEVQQDQEETDAAVAAASAAITATATRRRSAVSSSSLTTMKHKNTQRARTTRSSWSCPSSNTNLLLTNSNQATSSTSMRGIDTIKVPPPSVGTTSTSSSRRIRTSGFFSSNHRSRLGPRQTQKQQPPSSSSSQQPKTKKAAEEKQWKQRLQFVPVRASRFHI